jgi:choline dehydrogenase-like flavoprotein
MNHGVRDVLGNRRNRHRRMNPIDDGITETSADAESRFSTDIAEAMGGDVAMNSLWRLFHVPVSVHNLGGCLMADSRNGGVTDPNGEVFGYPNLFILDGSILPSAIGANPSHTIAAVAERNIETAIRLLLFVVLILVLIVLVANLFAPLGIYRFWSR